MKGRAFALCTHSSPLTSSQAGCVHKHLLAKRRELPAGIVVESAVGLRQKLGRGSGVRFLEDRRNGIGVVDLHYDVLGKYTWLDRHKSALTHPVKRHCSCISDKAGHQRCHAPWPSRIGGDCRTLLLLRDEKRFAAGATRQQARPQKEHCCSIQKTKCLGLWPGPLFF